MAKINFTADRVASFEAASSKNQTIYWDVKAPGLGMRVTPGGARAYVYESRLCGKTIRMTIGDARAWTLGKARTEAARLKTAIDDGIDPREQAAKQRIAYEARKAETSANGAGSTEALNCTNRGKRAVAPCPDRLIALTDASLTCQNGPGQDGKGATRRAQLRGGVARRSY